MDGASFRSGSGSGISVASAVANAPSLPSRSRLLKTANGSSVQIDEGFDRAWRRVGLALDRVGFTVEDRDRSQGIYFVRYVDQDQDVGNKDSSGFFSKLFSSSREKNRKAVSYRIIVEGSGDTSHITVQNNDGQQEISQTADRILDLLNDQLK